MSACGACKISLPENKTFSKVKPDSRPLELMYFMMRLKVLLFQSRLEKILKPVFHRFHFKAMFISLSATISCQKLSFTTELEECNNATYFRVKRVLAPLALELFILLQLLIW